MARDAGPIPRKFQFTVRQLLGLLLALGVILAMVTQLRHVGAVAALYLSGIALGIWLSKWRLAAASGTALLIYVVTYAACWLQLGYANVMDRRRFEEAQLRWMGVLVEAYAEENGEYPRSLWEVPEIEASLSPTGPQFHYQRTENGYELAWLGNDGKPGGQGPDADVALGPDGQIPWRRLSLRRFLFETDGSGALFMVACVASFLSAAIWYRAQPAERPSARRMAIELVVTIVAATVVAVFLAAVHVALSQSSGH